MVASRELSPSADGAARGDLAALLARVEAATGGENWINADLWKALGGVDEQHCARWCRMDGRTDLTRDDFIYAWAPNFSGSLDAALALCERVLPGISWTAGSIDPPDGAPQHWAVLYRPGGRSAGGSHDAKTTTLALLAALLKALCAQAHDTPNASQVPGRNQ